MKRVRLFAMLLSTTLFVSAIPVTGVNAAMNPDTANNLYVSEEAAGAASAKAAGKQGWVKNNNKWYYVTAKGNQTGWAKIDGKYYYFNSDGAMATGFVKYKEKWYYLAKNGEMKTSWQKVNNKWYYFDPSTGAMKTGWLRLGNKKWFYLDPQSGAMTIGWRKIDGKWYYFNNIGKMYVGPHVYKIDDVYYFFESSGALTTKTGWQESDLGNTFYTNANGTVVTNKEVDGKLINAEGIAVNKVNDVMDQKAQWYDSETNYLVLADLDAHELRVYQGKKGNWKRIKGSWDLTCGAPATSTPCGQFQLCYKYDTDYGWKNFSLSRAAYVYWTTAGFMIHTILYSNYGGDDPEDVEVVDSRLGMNLSLGCIRLSLENARWIYNNIPTGTKLVVYE